MVRDLASSAVTISPRAITRQSPPPTSCPAWMWGWTLGQWLGRMRCSTRRQAVQQSLVLERYEAGAGFTQLPIVDSSPARQAKVSAMPRIWMRGDGAGSVFYLKYDGGIYALYRADFASTGFQLSSRGLIPWILPSVSSPTSRRRHLHRPLGPGAHHHMPYQRTAGDYAGLAREKAALGGINRPISPPHPAWSSWPPTKPPLAWAGGLAINASAHAATVCV